MWVQTDNGVENLETGLSFGVECQDTSRGVRTWDAVVRRNGRGRRVLQSGYKTENEARAALDEFLAANDVVAVAMAEPNDEDTEAEAVADGVDRGENVGKG
jgi:hypothetical protein